jgi:3-hydroxyacyl-CoA dehydrogenase/enoyl-CoA hydratase/3-hydroxybutyryl-CoA epimerase
MTGYQDPTDEDAPIGLAAFVARADELADRYGDRFRPTDRLREMAEKGETFPS